MLSVRDLTKSYKAKGGVVTKALDGVSIDFPERGMVFILGKSGSGKSTLLNVTGGLDRPDSGEIIVKGKSSKDFTAADFDSYRNTFIGFIFQEYNILSEFNVEQNIALALQLQGKKNDKAAVEALLEKVDLSGYGHRKPNTLSGGQKQRVAIARALIKDPEIIMADEPTGALDSKTGKDIMDTLKKLSKEKLVIIVSHDLDFAEQYGDRIVEMKDGKIISDVTKNYAEAKQVSENVSLIAEDTLRVRGGARLTDEELEKIRSVIENAPAGSETIISADEKKVENFKRSNNITDEGSSEYFSETMSKDIQLKEYDGKSTKFIKSRLPFGHALRMGASGLKTKPVRLILTIIITVVAFGLFGVLSTMMMYDMNYSVASALEGQDYHTFMIEKQYDGKIQNTNIDYSGGEKTEYVSEWETQISGTFTSEDIAKYNNSGYGIDYAGVLGSISKSRIMFGNVNSSNDPYYSAMPIGYTDASEEFMRRNFGDGYILCGRAPVAADEVAISKYTYELIVSAGGIRPDNDNNGNETVGFEPKENMQGVDEDILGAQLKIYNGDSDGVFLTITAVYDVGEVPQKFDSLRQEGGIGGNNYNQNSYKLQAEMSASFHCLFYVAPAFIDAHIDMLDYDGYDNSNTIYVDMTYSHAVTSMNYTNTPMEVLLSSNVSSDLEAYSFNGEEISFDGLKKGEVIIPAWTFGNMIDSLLYSAVETYETDGYVQTITYDTTLPEEELEIFLSVRDYCNGSYGKDFTFDDVKYVLKQISEKWDSVVLSDVNREYRETFSERVQAYDKIYLGSELNESNVLNVAGVYFKASGGGSYQYVLNSETLEMLGEKGASYNQSIQESISDYVRPENARYNAILTNLDNTSYDALMYMLSPDGAEDESARYVMMGNSVYDEASSSASMFESLTLIFGIVGGVLAGLSALLLFNYISVSISDKRKEIGILRAVGARGSDVFKIFICESIMIAVICGILAIIGAFAACVIINKMTVTSAIAIELLNFGIVNALIVFGMTLVVAFIGTVLPVILAARKVPVESIRAL